MLQSEWFQYYTELPERDNGSYILQSWDTAAKLGLLNSFSVCTTWLVNGRDYYLLDVFRQKVTYPALRDLKQINSHLIEGAAYPVLRVRGALLPTRLRAASQRP